MPSRAAPAPRRRPRWLAGFGALPQGEVTLVTFPRPDALTLVDVVNPVAGQLSVRREAHDVEVDVAAAGIGVTGVNQALYQFDDLSDVPGGAWLRRRR